MIYFLTYTWHDYDELTHKSRKLGNIFVTCKAEGIGSYNQKGPSVHINKYILIEKARGQRHATQNKTVPKHIPVAPANSYSRGANNLLASV